MNPTARLEEVCTIIMGQAPSSDAYNTNKDGWPLIAGAGDFSGSRPSPKKFTTTAPKISRPGDIILGIRASIGAKVLSDAEYCLGRGVAALRPGPKLDRRYLWNWLSHNSSLLASKGKGATFKQVNRSDIGEMPICLPPLHLQQKIAQILDSADRLRIKRREAIALLDNLAQSIFLNMFGHPFANPMKFPISNVNEIAEKVTDGEHLTPKRETDGIKLLSARNVRDGSIDFSNVDFIGIEEFNRIKKRCEPRRGDILISCSGTIGRVSSVETDEPFALVRSVALIRPRVDTITTDYLSGYLRTKALKERMVQRAKSSSQANLFQGPIRELPVLLPPIDLQLKFGQAIKKFATIKDNHLAHLAELDALFASLQDRAFRGKLWAPAS